MPGPHKRLRFESAPTCGIDADPWGASAFIVDGVRCRFAAWLAIVQRRQVPGVAIVGMLQGFTSMAGTSPDFLEATS